MQLAEVMKLKLHTDEEASQAFADTAYQYMLACDAVSQYAFENGIITNSVTLSKLLYHRIRLDAVHVEESAEDDIPRDGYEPWSGNFMGENEDEDWDSDSEDWYSDFDD